MTDDLERKLRSRASTVTARRAPGLAATVEGRYPAWRRSVRTRRAVLGVGLAAALVVGVTVVAWPSGNGHTNVATAPPTSTTLGNSAASTTPTTGISVGPVSTPTTVHLSLPTTPAPTVTTPTSLVPTTTVTTPTTVAPTTTTTVAPTTTTTLGNSGPIPGRGVQVTSLSGINPQWMDCPAVGTCYVAGQPEPLTVINISHYRTEGMLVTHDGGKTWHLGGPDLDRTLTCPSAQVCAGVYGTGSNNDFWETTDGGMTWSSLPIPNGASALSCVSAASCVAIDQTSGMVDLTSDGGKMWAISSLPSSASDFDPFGVQCFTSGRCVAIGNLLSQDQIGATVALYSTDGGTKWTEATIPSNFHIYGDLSCGTSMDCMAVGDASGAPAIATNDGGQTWQAVTNPKGFDGTKGTPQVGCVGSGECWLQGNLTSTIDIVETTDLGRTWQPFTTPASVGGSTSTEVSCPTTTACYAVGVSLATSPSTTTTTLPGPSAGPFDFLSWDPATSTGNTGAG